MRQIVSDNEPNRIVFHYNRKHNEDSKIPTWVIKHKGQTYYVNHLVSSLGFRTKETPENEHTKGVIQFHGRLIINEDETGIQATIF